MTKAVVSVAIIAALVAAAPVAQAQRPAAVVPPLCTAFAPIVYVDAGDYSPKLQTMSAPGAQQEWDWHTFGASETVTSTGIKLFDSGPKTSGSSTFTFFAAGRFPYHSNGADTQTGAIAVKLCIDSTQSAGRAFAIRFASKHHTGWVSDLQIKRPGQTSWHWLSYGNTGTYLALTLSTRGKYHVRARLRRVQSGNTSAFSPSQTITVS